MRFSPFDTQKSAEHNTKESRRDTELIDEITGDPRNATVSKGNVVPSTPKYRVVSTATYGSFEGPF